MPGPQSASLISELEAAVNGGSSERRVAMLRQVTDLFLSDADRLSETQIGVFDDVLTKLIDRVEARTLAQLSTRLSPVDNAPGEVVRQLAFHKEVEVAGPVLAKSSRLSESDLVEIASTRGQQHLLAISSRTTLNEVVTDVLIKRGDNMVAQSLARNEGARFSETGYSSLVERAERDDSLAEQLGLRLDIPIQLLRDLLAKASQAVKARLLQAAPPEMLDKINAAINTVVEQIGGGKPVKKVDYTAAEAAVLALSRAGNLNDQAVNRFAVDRNYHNVIAALSLLSSTRIDAIEPLLTNPKLEGLILACKASRLNWSTTSMIIRNRPNGVLPSQLEFDEAKNVYEAVSLSAAQRTMRFWSTRATADKPQSKQAAQGRS